MDISPDSSPAKRSRAKPKVVVANGPAEAKQAAKKPRTPRKSPIAKTTAATAEDVGSMIATAAYYLAAARNFSPGHELEDWLEAERAVHAQLYG